MERFDKLSNDRESAPAKPVPTANGTNGTAPSIEKAASPPKRKALASVEADGAFSSIDSTPPPHKKAKKEKVAPKQETDEELARRLQAEYAAPVRSTRNAGTSASKPRKSSAPSKKKTPKKKSSARVHSDDDSALSSSGEGKLGKEREKKGGFHKPMHLSGPLQALLGESVLSRPQTVKRIWAYVKERDLQDPSDKRQIRCDEAMRAVFKSERVHMFTMNKVLAGQLWPVEEGENVTLPKDEVKDEEDEGDGVKDEDGLKDEDDD